MSTVNRIESGLPSSLYGILSQLLYDPSKEILTGLVVLRLWSLLHLHTSTVHHKGIVIHGDGCAGSGRVVGGSDGAAAGRVDGEVI